MPIWLVKAVWTEDEAEASEKWEVDANSAYDAIKEVAPRFRFQPHYVEARLYVPAAEESAPTIDVQQGKIRRVLPQ